MSHPALVPELLVKSIAASLDFWCGLCRFEVVYDRPLGRGVNFQIAVAAIGPVCSSLREAGWPLFVEPEVKRYRTGTGEVGVEQFLVADPDGYLLRFQAPLLRS